MPGVLVAGSERREDKNRNINDGCRKFMQIEKPVKFIMPPRSSFSWNLHYSFQGRIIEMKSEIKSPLMNLLVR